VKAPCQAGQLRRGLQGPLRARIGTLHTLHGTTSLATWYLSDVLPRLSDLPVNKGQGHLASLTPKGWKAANTGE